MLPSSSTKEFERIPAVKRVKAEIYCALGRNRTYDQEIRRLLLYPLSYEGSLGL